MINNQIDSRKLYYITPAVLGFLMEVEEHSSETWSFNWVRPDKKAMALGEMLVGYSHPVIGKVRGSVNPNNIYRQTTDIKRFIEETQNSHYTQILRPNEIFCRIYNSLPDTAKPKFEEVQ